MENEEKVLTRELVEKLGLDKLEVITSDMIEGYTSIGSDAFRGCTSITSINIPNSVTSIGVGAFYNVPNIVYSGTVKGSPWGARSVNGYVDGYLVYADETKTTLLACSTAATGDITIPNSVTIIGDSAFEYCASIDSITIGNSVTSIRSYAFFGCTSLTSITLPNSVITIGYSAFESCSSITSITISNSIKSIKEFAFCNCNKLKNVVIDDKVYKKHKVINGKCKAYKAFNADLTCRDFQYEEGKTYEIDGEPELCSKGFHACLRLTDVFSYYYGDLGKEIVVHEVELEGVSDERNEDDSKIVAKKITIGKRIL